MTDAQKAALEENLKRMFSGGRQMVASAPSYSAPVARPASRTTPTAAANDQEVSVSFKPVAKRTPISAANDEEVSVNFPQRARPSATAAANDEEVSVAFKPSTKRPSVSADSDSEVSVAFKPNRTTPFVSRGESASAVTPYSFNNKLRSGLPQPADETIPFISGEKSARQKMLSDDSAKPWFKGAVPTASEIAARIIEVSGGKDTEEGSKLFDTLQALRADPSSEIYDPYTGATNSAISSLQALGVDTYGGINQDWIEKNSYLKNYFRTGVNGTPLAPTEKSSKEEQAAYYYYKVLQDEDTTQKAETEWAALRDEVTYWAGRKDRNYSDDEILSRINWKDYPTLVSMDDGRTTGAPVQLNRRVGYSQDNLKGLIWAARNGSTGDIFADSVAYSMGKGTQYQKDDKTAALLDPTSDEYDPYKVGSTLDDAALYFGVTSFDKDWLKKNKNVLAGNDKTAISYYQKVYDAEQFTQTAETELADLKTDIDGWLKYTSDPDAIMDGLLDKYPALEKINESLDSGDLLSTTRAIDFKLQDVEKDIRDRCEKINSEKQGAEYSSSVVKVLGGAQNKDDSAIAVDAARDNTINAAGGTIKQYGTAAEKVAFDLSYSSDFGTYVKQIKSAMDTGISDPTALYQYSVERSDEYAAKNYIAAKDTVAQYEEAVAKKAAAQQTISELGANVLPAAETEDDLHSASEYIEQHQAEYDAAKQTLSTINEAYSASAKLYQGNGASGGNPAVGGILPVMDYAYYYGKNYTPTQWSAQNVYDAAMSGGYSYENTAQMAKAQIDANDKEIARIDYVLQQLDSGKVNIDSSYKTNLLRRKAAIQRDSQDAQYFTLRSASDFDSASSSYAQKATKTWATGQFRITVGGTSLFGTGTKDGVSYLSYCVANPAYGINENMAPSMTDAERKTYLYIADKQGEGPAQEYYNHITDPTYGTIPVRNSQKFQEIVSDFADQNAVGSTLLSVVASPFQAVGAVYALGTAIAGKEINPYNPSFSGVYFVQGTRTEVKANITKEFGDGTLASKLANIGYDVGTAVGDSWMAGALSSSVLSQTGRTLTSVTMMATEASSAAIQDAKQRGATDQQALLQGGATFAAESITEYIPMDKMFSALKSGAAKDVRKFAGEFAVSVLSEGLGEAANQAVESLSDNYIMQKLSNRETSIQKYIESGMTRAQAEDQATKDFWYDVEYAGIVGALSGGASTGGAYLLGTMGANSSETGNSGPPEQQEAASAPVAPDGGVQAPAEAPVAQQEAPAVQQEAPAVPVEAQGETSSDNVSPEMNPVIAPAENQSGVPAAQEQTLTAQPIARKVAALTTALSSNDISSQTATIAAALMENDSDSYAATAAAKKLVSQYGAVPSVRAALGLALYNEPGSGLAVMQAVLSNDSASQTALQSIADIGPTDQNVAALIEAAKAVSDTKAVQSAITESMIAERTKEIIADGALDGLASYRVALKQASENVVTARGQLQQAQNQYAAAGQSLQFVNSQFIQNPTDPVLRNSMSQAIADMDGKAKVVQQMQQSVDKYTGQKATAQSTLNSVQESMLNKARTQAIKDVSVEQAARAEIKKGEILRDLGNGENAGQPETPATGQSTGEQSVPVKNSVSQKNSKSNFQIIKNLSADTGIPIDEKLKTFLRSERKKAKGYTRDASMIVHVMDAQNLSTVGHELGHVFDSEFGIAKTQDMDALLTKMLQNQNEALFLAQYDADARSGEAVAEVVRAWMVSRDSAIGLAGLPFVTKLEELLASRKGPNGDTWLKSLTKAAADFSYNRSLSAAQLAEQRIVLEEQKGKLTVRSAADKLATGLFDYTKPLLQLTRLRIEKGLFDMSHDPRTLMLRKESSIKNYANSCMFDTLVGPEGRNQVLADEGLFTPFEGLKDTDERPLAALWELLHAKSVQQPNEQTGTVRRIFGPDIDIDAAIKQLQNEHPDYMEKIERFEKNYDLFMRAWLVDTGLLPAEVYESMHAKDPYYVPSFRAIEKQSTGMPTDAGSPGSGLSRATLSGATTDISNPFIGIAEYVQRYISNYRTVEALRAFSSTMKNIGSYNGIAEPVQKDVGIQRGSFVKSAMLDAADAATQELTKNGAITEETAQALLQELANVSDTAYFIQDKATGNNTINVPESDGTISSWTVYNKEMFNALCKQPASKQAKTVAAVGRLTRLLCSFATNRNVAFVLHNYSSDSETAMNTGTQSFLRSLYPVFIAEQIGTLGKLVRNKFAETGVGEALGMNTSEDFKRFELEAQMGTRFSLQDVNVQKQIRGQIFKKTGVAAVSDIAKKISVSPIIAIEKAADLLEDATRFNEFMNGAYRNDTSYAGDIMRAKGAREATVDFSKSGAWDDVKLLGSFIPFIRANLEGVYKTARLFSAENSGNRLKTAAAILVNSVFAGAAVAAIRAIRWDDDEKKAYDSMTDYERARYYHFKVGDGEDAKFIRIKRSQDLLIQTADALGQLIGGTFTGAEENDLGAFMGSVKEIINGALIDVTNNTFSPFVDAMNNRTWYGGEIEDYSMQELPETARYDTDTPVAYRGLSYLLNAVGIKYSPADLQYIIKQYMGSLGQTGTDILNVAGKDSFSVDAVVGTITNSVMKKFILDPAYSNNITSSFYDGKNWLEQIVAEAKSGSTVTYFRRGLSQEEADSGLAEATAMLGKGGVVQSAYKQTKDLWEQYNAILNSDYDNAKKEELAREVRKQINETLLPANAAVEDFKKRYGYSTALDENAQNFMALVSGDKATPTAETDYDQVADTFKADYDSGALYMQQAYSVWNETGKASALPHPNSGFSYKETKYEISAEEMPGWTEQYKKAYVAYMAKSGKDWDQLSADDKLSVLSKAHDAGHDAAKAWYMKLKKIK